MADKKAERLINLTIALLATKRFLKKSEIFATVAGYSGSAESMDRMFERDKSELRNLGIDISVGDLDPLFDDEPGYRINRDSYEFQLKNLDPTDVGILSVAAKLWNDSVLGADAQSGLLKLESIETSDNVTEPITFSYRYEDPAISLITIESAIIEGRTITFKYGEMKEDRELDPYRIFLWNGYWYVIGMDRGKKAIRSFKVSRMTSDVIVTKNKANIPENFDIKKHLPSKETFNVRVLVPEGKCAVLRSYGLIVGNQEQGDELSIDFPDSATALREFLRHGDSALVVAPKDFAGLVKEKLLGLSNV
jgi:proteasome accessory factor B